MRKGAIAVLAAASTLFVVVPAAQAMQQFRTPSGNIWCGSFTKNRIRCDQYNITYTPPPKPASCEFDWGSSFGLTSNGRGRRLCVSDAATEGKPKRVLKYGQKYHRGKMTCTSRVTGLTCKNKKGHGFFTSTTSSRVF